MDAASIARSPATWFGVGIVALASAAGIGGARGGEGMALGLAGATFGVTALCLLVKLLSRAADGTLAPGFGVFLTILAFLGKLPLYYVLWQVSQRIGDPAPGCFLAGVVLVYFAFVVWAINR